MSEHVYLRHVVAVLGTNGHVAFAELRSPLDCLYPPPQVLIRIVIPPNRQAVPRKAKLKFSGPLNPQPQGKENNTGPP